MNLNRRMFFSSLLLARRPQPPALRVAVLEVFPSRTAAGALLVHHATEATREIFANSLQAHRISDVQIRTDNGREVQGTLFRVRMCFGRGLILLKNPLEVTEREILTVIYQRP
jgi:hypothetical protein